MEIKDGSNSYEEAYQSDTLVSVIVQLQNFTYLKKNDNFYLTNNYESYFAHHMMEAHAAYESGKLVSLPSLFSHWFLSLKTFNS